MAVSLDNTRQYELEQLIVQTMESLEGASSIIASLGEAGASAQMRAQLHAVEDVLVVCRTRLEAAANMLDE